MKAAAHVIVEAALSHLAQCRGRHLHRFHASLCIQTLDRGQTKQEI